MAAAKEKEAKKGASKGAGSLYQTSPSFSRKNQLCPKCNVFMANHKDRKSCGKCGHTEKA